VAGHGSATSQPDSDGPAITIELGWKDFITLVPVNASQNGEQVLLLAEVSWSLMVDGSDPEDSRADTFWRMGSNWTICDDCDDSIYEVDFREDGPATVTDTKVLGFIGRLGEWLDLESYMAINIGSNYDGSTSSAQASLQIDRLIEVVDLDTREPIAIREICTASGATY
jgi:hypothetical protein